MLQKLEGDGLAFVHAGGTVVRRELQPGQTLLVDTGCLVAMTPNVDFDIQYVGKIKTALFGGEGVFLARVVDLVTSGCKACRSLASRIFCRRAADRGGQREARFLAGWGGQPAGWRSGW